MAVTGRGLRYYRDSYNPGSSYYGGTEESPVISMYNPQSQQQFIQAVAQRQERFDATNAAVAAEKARIGETETYDLPELTKRLKDFESNINTTVKDKYNGDYGAAANEIAKMIGTERTNPFYQFNKQKVEMSKAYLDTKMKLGSNFLSAGNPLNVTFQDWQQGKTFDFTPVNREDIVRQSAQEFSSLANTIMSDPKLQSTAGGQYFLSTMQYGLKDPQALQEYLGTEQGQQMIANIKANNPTLAQLPQDQVMSAIIEGAHSAIGKTVKDYMADQSYLDALQQSRIKGSQGASESTGKISTLGYIPGPKGSDGKEMAIPIHSLTTLYGTTTAETNEVIKNIEGIDTYLTEKLQPGDLQGMTEKDSKLLKDIANKKLVSFSMIPTTDPKDFFILNLNIIGTPAKTKNNKSPVPVYISTKVMDSQDKLNLFRQLSLLDPIVFNTYMDQLRDINPQAYLKMTGAIDKAKTPK
jgi:hypothetical protein